MKKKIPLLLIIASAILIIGDFIFSKGFDGGFWTSILSSLFIILSMVLLILANKKRDQN
jgi:hypothetical protein